MNEYKLKLYKPAFNGLQRRVIAFIFFFKKASKWDRFTGPIAYNAAKDSFKLADIFLKTEEESKNYEQGTNNS